MFKPRYLLLLLALAAVGAVGWVLRAAESRTAASLLAAAERRLAAEDPDYDAALRELDRALELAVAAGQGQVAREAFLTRARTYVERGVLGKARSDYETVRSEYAGGSAEVAVEIGAIDLALGNHGAALQTAESVLAKRPNDSAALALRGRALYEMGALAMSEAEVIFEAVLHDEDARKASDLAWRAATLEFDHPYRAAAVSELGTFPETAADIEGVHRYVDVATSCLTEARGALVHALDREMRPEALVQLLVLLERGGRYNDVVDLGVAGSFHREVQQDTDGLLAQVRALDALDRAEFAATILSEANQPQVDMPRELLATWCRLLYEAEEWRRLVQVSTATMSPRGREEKDLVATARFFRGFANLNLQRWEEAKADFRSYVGQPPWHEPMPMAKGWAYYGLARAWAGIGDTFAEHLNLQRAVEAAPRIDAEVWVSYADAQLARKLSAGTAAETLFTAIARATPQQRGPITKRWDHLSRKAMDARGRELDDLRRRARKKGAFVLRGDPAATSWEFHQLGLQYAEEGQRYGALNAGRALLDRCADHVFGLDLLIEGHAMAHAWPKTTELLLRRARLYGPHPKTRDLARRIPPGMIAPEDYLQLMELDPLSTGLLPMVDSLAREGRLDLAIESLSAVPPGRRAPEATLRLAELQAEARLLPQALESATQVPLGAEERARAIELALVVATDMRKPGFLAQVTPGLLEGAREADLEPAATERAALWLLAHGQTAPAHAMLGALDRPATRTGEALVGLALAKLALGRHDDAEDTLDRAEPFLTSPEAAVGRLALLAETGRWTETPAEVELYRATEPPPSPRADAALLALSERVRDAAAAAALALEDDEADPVWHLVLAGANRLLPEEERLPHEPPYPEQTDAFFGAAGDDPRAVLTLVVALETESGAAWAHHRLLAIGLDGGRLWPPWLMAQSYERLGRHRRAVESVEALVKNVQRFEPAWRWLEEDLVRSEGTRLTPAYAAFVERRGEALGLDPDEDPLSTALVYVQRRARAGKLAEAVATLERMRPALEGSPVGLINTARALRLAGARRQAVEEFARAVAQVPPDEGEHVAEEFIALGTEAYLERSLSRTAWRAHLSALLVQLPEDPMVSLAWARFERQTADDPAKGWDLARAEYERFREATGGVSLDALRPGSAAAWAEFFLSESPTEAEAMIREELLVTPGSPDLWRLLGQALEAQGRIDEAFERYVAVANILPDPETLRRAADILAQRGNDHALLEQTVQRIVQVERPTGPDLTLELLRARSLAHSSADGTARAIPIFERIWDGRRELRKPSDRIELAEAYAVALLHRGDPADAELIDAILAEALPRISDPVRRDLFQAYRNLAQWMPEPAEPAAEEAVAGDPETP